MEYGLIGRNVQNSFSKLIHNKLGYDYDLISLNEEELNKFLEEKNFKGINVTIPYKETVLKHLNFVSSSVKSIGVCNCIVNKEGMLYGYNTDYDGVKYLLDKNNFSMTNKKVLILGTGGTCKTVSAVLKDLNVNKIYVASRNPNDDQISYQVAQNLEVDYIINTTPNGMIGYSDDLLLDLSKYSKLEGVIDVIYNPLKTRLIKEAEKLDIPCCNGLMMLVYQAIKASEYFFDKEIDEHIVNEIYCSILDSKTNIVLIGLPGCGKTTIGELLSKELNKDFIDLDKEIVKKEERSINEIFLKDGEQYFRNIESNICKEISKEANKVIATGGGVILNKENIEYLSKNGIVIFLDRKLENYLITNDRPLTKSKKDLERLHKERYNLYLSSCDQRVEIKENLEEDVKHIKELYYEIINR